jgi:3-hydroxyisobutyrate dehydrogenase-like beta-hydroxyacid dehydrogenase
VAGLVLGFVGLGRMGRPMSARLAAAGHRVVGFDAAGSPERAPAGVAPVDSLAELGREAGVVLLSLPDGAASRAVCAAIAAARGPVDTVIDLSTIGIEAARACAAELAGAGIGYVDAPVSGGVAGAAAGTLSIMVGAPAERFEAVRPLLEGLGGHVFRLGDAPGAGQAMKLLNNYCSAAALAATCEAAVFAERLGLDLARVIEVINVSTGRSSASLDKFPRSIVPRTYDYGFAGALMTKDVTLYLESAEAAGVPRALAEAVAALWQRFNAAHPDADFTYLHRYLEDLAAGR